MKNIKSKFLCLFTSGLFLIAIQAVNSVSNKRIYQDKEPDSLKKYERL